MKITAGEALAAYVPIAPNLDPIYAAIRGCMAHEKSMPWWVDTDKVDTVSAALIEDGYGVNQIGPPKPDASGKLQQKVIISWAIAR